MIVYQCSYINFYVFIEYFIYYNKLISIISIYFYIKETCHMIKGLKHTNPLNAN